MEDISISRDIVNLLRKSVNSHDSSLTEESQRREESHGKKKK